LIDALFPPCLSRATLGRIGLKIGRTRLLNCPYFHVVFTLREQIAAIGYQNRAVAYNLLFAGTADTLRTIAAKCGAPH
jgi:hypothetical protein